MKFKLIQVFRAAAAILVILYHLILHIQNGLHYQLFNNFFRFGLVGVDFFFVLSGFIITYVHYGDIGVRERWARFYTKRFIRIYPLYWVIAICSVIIFVFMTPNRMKDAGLSMDLTSPYILTSLLQSFLLIPQKGMYLVGVAWTLSYEVLFYLIFGLCIVGGHRFARVAMVAWLLLILANSLFLHTGNFYLNFLLNPVIIEFMMGCLVGYVVVKQKKISATVLYILLPVMFLITINVVKLDGLRIERSLLYVLLLGILFSLLTLLAVKTDIRKPNIKYPALLLLLGDSSYAIYLFHQTFYTALMFIYQKFRHVYGAGLHPVVIAMLIFAIAATGGVLIHALVEKPLLKWLHKLIPKTSLKKAPHPAQL